MISNDYEWWLTYWPTIFHQPFRSHWDYSISNGKYDDHPLPHPLGLPWTQPRRPKSFAWFCRWLRASCRMAPVFFGFGSAQGVPQGSCEHFVSKNTEDSKIHSASHEKHFKTVMDPREWTTEIGQFYLVFPCVLLFFWGLETTSNSFETVIWSSLGWSNMKDPLGAT